ncbi:MAG: hypothetical protein ACKO8Q_11005, partial [Bacteroidota bacterium]
MRDSISDFTRFCAREQTYFRKNGISRNSYAGIWERFALLELRYWKTCGFIGTLRVMGTSLLERYALLELRCEIAW